MARTEECVLHEDVLELEQTHARNARTDLQIELCPTRRHKIQEGIGIRRKRSDETDLQFLAESQKRVQWLVSEVGGLMQQSRCLYQKSEERCY